MSQVDTTSLLFCSVKQKTTATMLFFMLCVIGISAEVLSMLFGGRR